MNITGTGTFENIRYEGLLQLIIYDFLGFFFLAKPDFTVIPSKSITRPVGGDAALKCEVTGKPKPLVQWYKNGKLISQEKQDSDGSLRFRSRQSDAGLYQCFVSNIAGSLSNRIYFSVRTRGINVLILWIILTEILLIVVITWF